MCERDGKFLTGDGFESLQMIIMEGRDERRSTFSKDLDLFPNGTEVSKHQSPWGFRNVLHNNTFTVKQKFLVFNNREKRDEVSHIILINCDDGNEVLLSRKYFGSWSSQEDMKNYYDSEISDYNKPRYNDGSDPANPDYDAESDPTSPHYDCNKK